MSVKSGKESLLDGSVRWVAQSGAPRLYTPQAAGNLPKEPLYRFMSVVQLVDLFEKSALTLVDPVVWPDKYEGAWIKKLCVPEGPLAGMAPRAICFTNNPYTEAFWRIYGRVPPVIRVRFRPQGLVRALCAHTVDDAKTYMSQVKYVQQSQIEAYLKKLSTKKFKGVAREIASFLMLKRKAFSHESEVRFVRVSKSQTDQFHRIPIEIDTAVDQIVLDPYSDPWMESSISGLLRNRYGFRGKIERSSLDKDPLAL